MTPRFIGSDELETLLPMTAAIDALEAAFHEGLPQAPPRAHVPMGEGELLLMPAVGPTAAGVKLVTVAPANPSKGLPLIHAGYILFDVVTGEIAAVIEGGALTALRTAAVSGVATRHLAPREARRLVIIGAGVQGTAHLDAMAAVRPIETVTVVSRTRSKAERLADRAAAVGLSTAVGDAAAVAEADIVCTCTTSTSPVFDSSLLMPGVHVNAVGAYQVGAQELDDDLIRRARVVVETREAAMSGGDVRTAVDRDVIEDTAVAADLRELVGGAAVRTTLDDITVFKSVGVASEDLVVAAAALVEA
ncbi:MAG: ornithine cyclodeaminase family protein [Actinomycetota bacterium]|nr:ornithine cyclodeaminase family protein [Actinomycetota bacterium]